MPYILIAFGDSEEPDFDSNRIDGFIDEVLKKDKPLPQRGRGGREQAPDPKARKCHVMNKAWMIEVDGLKTDEVAKMLEARVPDKQPFIVVPLSHDWEARNGASTASKCFSY